MQGGGFKLRAILIKGECIENIVPNSCCFADITTKMCQAFLMIPLVLCILHSPFHSNDDVTLHVSCIKYSPFLSYLPSQVAASSVHPLQKMGNGGSSSLSSSSSQPCGPATNLAHCFFRFVMHKNLHCKMP